MSGPKCNEVKVVSREELQRREDNRRRNNCNILKDKLDNINNALYSDVQVIVNKQFEDNHDGLIKREKYLEELIRKANDNINKQNKVNTKCEIMMKQIDSSRLKLTHPDDFKVDKPKFTTLSDAEQFLVKLEDVLCRIEIQSEKDAILFKHKTQEKIDTSNVDLTNNLKEELIQKKVNKRRIKLNKIAEKICSIDDEALRESYVLKASPLLDLDKDSQFNDRCNDLFSEIRNLRKMQKFKTEAIEEVAKVSHIKTNEVEHLNEQARASKSLGDLQAIKKEVNRILCCEDKEEDKKYISNSICEILTELGYDFGEGFEQTDFGSVAVAQKNDTSKHAMRVQVTEKENDTVVYTRVVSIDETTAEQDKKAEEEMCDDCHAIRKGLRIRGCEANLTREVAPGESKVENIAKKHRAKRRAQQKRQRIAANKRRSM